MIGRSTPARGVSRVCRGVVLAGTSATLAVAAHAAAGGGLPNVGLTLLLTVGVAGVGIALGGRRSSMWAILGVLGAAELAMHMLLSLSMMQMAGMDAPRSRFNSLAMLLAHTVAVLVTAALLYYADDAMSVVASAVARLVPTVLVAPLPEPNTFRAVRPAVAPVICPAAVLLCRANARRGPPVVA
jgi:hypothetical protein